MILGIDIGGTSVKCGIVSHDGEIAHVRTFMTKTMVETHGFVDALKIEIGNYLKDFPAIKGVGMGFPGLLSADRKRVLLMANIPSVNDAPIVEILNSSFPGIVFKIENDAKCAALGEHYFGPNKGLDNYLMITLGTGVGGALVIDRKLFLGAKGNGLEIGHILSSNGVVLEENVGISHLIRIANQKLNDFKGETLLRGKEINPKVIFECAQKGDALAKEIFNHVGYYIGEAMVGILRTLDVENILIGGGISGALEFIVPEMLTKIKKHLPGYYTDNLYITRAALGNDAGLLGAAGLIIENFRIDENL